MFLKSHRGLTRVTVALAALALTGAGAAASIAAPATSPSVKVTHTHACAAPSPRHAACLAVLDTDQAGHPLDRTAAEAAGLHPYTAADLQDAYNLPSDLVGARQTVAIVISYHDPTAEADLAVYRAENGLPPCTTDNGCFRQVDQRGGTDFPSPEGSWAVEQSLDLDMVSASCPNCSLLVVEADDEFVNNLALAEDEAVALGATVVTNSYGAFEYSTELSDSEFGHHYDHPGVTILASSGDAGFGVQVPAGLSTVVAVGGTSLFSDAGTARGWAETAWVGAGSGCSAYVAKPSWQHDKLCDNRTVADVAAVADPSTPVAIYDTFGELGWLAAGGTSVASPLLAGVYALAGNAAVINPGAHLYANRRSLFDVTSGSNGSCGGGYLCTATRGYDGPTGLGTPNGIGAF